MYDYLTIRECRGRRRPASLTDDWGGVTTYGFSENGRLDWLQLSSTLGTLAEASLTYTKQNWLETVTLQDGTANEFIVSTYDHDDAGRLKSITHEQVAGSTTTTLSEFTYTLDDANRITSYAGPEGTRDYKYGQIGVGCLLQRWPALPLGTCMQETVTNV